jgi:CRISP-associated protein Cas1
MEVVLHSYGARLRLSGGLFKLEVPDISGAESLKKKLEYAPEDVETILLHPHTSVSTDALLHALEQATDVLVLDQFGQPQGRLWANRPSATLEIQKAQLALSGTARGLAFARAWLVRKMHGKNAMLGRLLRYRRGEKHDIIVEARKKISELTVKLSAASLTPVKEAAATLRGIEGTACKIYFDTLNKLLPKEYRFDGRSRRPAKDMFNAFLNYGYGILYRQVEKALIMAGVHPYIGFMHRDEYLRKSMVFDYIEPYRHWVEQSVLSLFASKWPSRQHLENKGEGFFLNWEGRKKLSKSYLDRFNREREDGGRTYTWRQILLQDAREFGSMLKSGVVLQEALPEGMPYG